MPGPLIAFMRTMPGPSLTAPESRHCTSASRRHGSRSANQPPPLQPASRPRTPRRMKPTRYQRTPHAMRPRMRWSLLTILQGFGGADAGWPAPRGMVKKDADEYRATGPEGSDGSQAATDTGAPDVERDGAHGHLARDLPQSRLRPRLPRPM